MFMHVATIADHMVPTEMVTMPASVFCAAAQNHKIWTLKISVLYLVLTVASCTDTNSANVRRRLLAQMAMSVLAARHSFCFPSLSIVHLRTCWSMLVLVG